jgi:hypothetical protein
MKLKRETHSTLQDHYWETRRDRNPKATADAPVATNANQGFSEIAGNRRCVTPGARAHFREGAGCCRALQNQAVRGYYPIAQAGKFCEDVKR